MNESGGGAQPVCAQEALDLLNCVTQTPYEQERCVRRLQSLRDCVLNKVRPTVEPTSRPPIWDGDRPNPQVTSEPCRHARIDLVMPSFYGELPPVWEYWQVEGSIMNIELLFIEKSVICSSIKRSSDQTVSEIEVEKRKLHLANSTFTLRLARLTGENSGLPLGQADTESPPNTIQWQASRRQWQNRNIATPRGQSLKHASRGFVPMRVALIIQTKHQTKPHLPFRILYRSSESDIYFHLSIPLAAVLVSLQQEELLVLHVSVDLLFASARDY
ncbi:hypothetical protein SAY86_023068 [Trapa natans]|uniref:Uncharacterized protein n=1 Tax=Trapa natans TaxID=22666 RepID=A0AAN7RB77_TRANT|nr:hypothetical protein SAY86_023068 [Trapa natans]